MSATHLFLISCILFFQTIEAKSLGKTEISMPKNIESPDSKSAEILMTLVGTVNGKTFFRDTVARTWDASKAYCTSLGMKLAYFSTVAESNFVKSKVPAGGYWTSGLDVPELNDFHWDSSAVAIPSHPFVRGATSTLNSLVIITSTASVQLKQEPRTLTYPPLCVIATA